MIPDLPEPRGDDVPLTLRERLASEKTLVAVELRPPRRDLVGAHAIDAWIDVFHAVSRLSALDTLVFITDNAVGIGEEENLGHLVRNLGDSAVRERIVPFLTLKHTLDYCHAYGERARAERFPGLVVLGGDKHDGIPRCLPHAWQLRDQLRERFPRLLLGGWANPHRDPEQQVGFLVEHRDSVDFALTQIISHHDLPAAERFMDEVRKQRLDLPIFAGVFYYRSARKKTLERLAPFIPVPAEELRRDFKERGMSAQDVCAASLRELADVGFDRFYVSNFETHRAARQLEAVTRSAGLAVEPSPARTMPRRPR